MASDDDLLSLLAPDARRALLARTERRVLEPGQILIRQDSAPRSLFRIHSGFARVQREHLGSRVELARMEPGMWLGELSLLDGAPASATVTAETRLEVDQLSAEALEDFLAHAPELAAVWFRALSVSLARRLRRLTAAIPERLFDAPGAETSLLEANELSSFLTASSFCDFEHGSIRSLSAKLAESAEGDAELARAAFYFVRDEVTDSLGQGPDRASETLARRRGSCSHKANLFVAILRAAGVPAGYHFMFVKTREYLGPMATRRMLQFMAPRSLHVFPAALLGDAWVRCDPADLRPRGPKLDFDGAHDAMLSLPPESIEYYDGTCWPAIDEVLSRTPPLPPVALTALDLYLEWCRGPGRAHPRADDAADAFFAWFRAQRPAEYAAFAAAEAERLARRPTS